MPAEPQPTAEEQPAPTPAPAPPRPSIWQKIALVTGLLVALVSVFGALETLGVTSLVGSDPILKATLNNVDREFPVTLAEYSESREIAPARDRPRGAGAPALIVASISPVGRLAAAPADADSDGVPDAKDRCPTTPAGRPVKTNGCAARADADSDGVADAQDRCPTTPAGRAVKTNGCAVRADADSDGVADAQDRCPTTPAGRAVKTNGCAVRADADDDDGDGVADARDNCPQTAAGTSVDAGGCPRATRPDEADRDGVGDKADDCPRSSPGGRVDSAGCPPQTAAAMVAAKSGCTTDAIMAAVDAAVVGGADRPRCSSAARLAEGYPGGDSKDVETRSRAILAVMRSTRTRLVRVGAGAAAPKSDGAAPAGFRREPVGIAVSFDLTLEGFDDREVEVRWSLYRDGGSVAKPWLRDHPVLSLKGEADNDTASAEFWVPMPKPRGRYSVRIEVFDDKGQKLTRMKTKTVAA